MQIGMVKFVKFPSYYNPVLNGSTARDVKLLGARQMFLALQYILKVRISIWIICNPSFCSICCYVEEPVSVYYILCL